MTPSAFPGSPFQPGMVPVQVPRQPTDAERREVEQVRSMQVRKDAVALAVEHYRGTGEDGTSLLTLAEAVARFILEGTLP